MSKGQKSLRFSILASIAFVVLFGASSVSAQLTGVKNIPGDYATVAAAVTDLNTQGVGAGGVTFTVADGHVETAPVGGFTITNPAGNGAGNPIVFQRGGGGTRPSFTASGSLTVGSLHDAIFEIIGTDNITIDGFEMLENPANVTTAAATNTMTEWGVAILYATTTNGSQNVTVQNCVIDLNRTYQNSFGIYSNSTHSATTVTTVATATTVAGGNSGLKVYGNSITDVNFGILVLGPTAAADNNSGVDIGGVAPSTGNTITNFGTTSTFSGFASVSATGWGVLLRNSTTINFSYNSLTSSTGGFTGGTSTTFRGLFVPAFTNAPTGTFTNSVNNNTINLTSGVSGTLQGITVESTTGTATSTQNINNNNFTALTASVASTGAATAISYAMANLSTNINNNTFTSLTSNTTGSFTFISASMTIPSGGTKNVTGNSIVTGFNKTGAGGTVTFYTDNGSSSTGTTTNVNNNTISNITVTGSTAVTGISDTDGGAPSKNVQNNTISNITGGLGAIIGITTNFDGGTTTISGNTVSNISNGAAITGILTGTSGSGGALTTNISQNTVHSFAGTGTVAAVVGISLGGTTGHIKNVTRNKIYNLESNNASGTVNGIAQTSVPTANISNNLIGDLRTTAANAANPLIGINITGGTTVTADFNTVYLNGSSTGALFGSSALSASSTPNVTLRNNILVNGSTTTGAGLAAAYRRSTTTLTTYNAASNNNDFFGSTIFTDGTNTDVTITGYKTRVASRDSASFSENPPFLSTTGSSADFLHINTVTPTQLESGGITVAGITVDYDGNTRAATPDIGADEFAGTLLDLVGPTITYTNLANTASTGDRVLTTTITDATGVPTSGVGLPIIYYRKNADPYASTQCSHVSGSTYDCSIVAAAVGGLTAGDAIFYYVAAQDTAGTPNVSVNPSAGAAGLTANPPVAATPPTTPNSYLIAAAISGTLTADGVGGGAPNFASLTNNGGVFEYINNNVVTGNITVNITADLTVETGTHALNAFDAPHTITIVPTGAARVVSGAAASTALIRTNGASRVTIDGSLGGGGTDRSLTISNTSVTTPQVVRFGSIGATAITANTLKNSIVINGVNTSSAVVVADSAGTAGTFNNITIQNNDIQRAFVGIFTNATVAPGNGANLLITQNKLDTSGANAIRNVGVYVQGANGATVSNNTIGNFDTANGEDDLGIWFATGTTNSTMSANTVTTLGMTAASVAFGPIGIADTSAAVSSGNNLVGNTVSNITTGTSATDAVFGILIQSGGTVVQRNTVTGINNTSTGTYGAFGIDIASGNNVVLRNNFVSNVSGNMTGGVAFSTGFGIHGIRINAGTGHQIQHNSVNMYGLRAGTATSSLLTSALCVVSTASTGMDIRNNIFANNITGGTTSVANVAVYLPSGGSSAMNLTANNNSYYFGTDVARAGAGQAGTTAGTNFFTTLSALAAYSSTLHVPATNDNASLSSTGAVPFISDTDLHITASATETAFGAAVSVSTDFDNDPRPASAPDIGADEIVQAEGGVVPAGTFYNASFGDGNTLAGNVSITNTLYLLGEANAGANTVSLGCNASVVGAGGGNYIVGSVTKQFCSASAFTFPIGTTSDAAAMGTPPEYTPVDVNVTAVNVVPSSLTTTSYDATLAGLAPATSLSRNWGTVLTGDMTYSLVLNYAPDALDVNGNEADYRVYARDSLGGLVNLCSGAPCVDTVNNKSFTVNGPAYSTRWTMAQPQAPTSSAASISGRVTTASGQGIRGAAIVITGNSLPTPIIAKTGSLGYFQVNNLDSGQTYVVTVVSKRFTFAQPSRVINLTDSINDADFVANPLE